MQYDGSRLSQATSKKNNMNAIRLRVDSKVPVCFCLGPADKSMEVVKVGEGEAL